MHIVGVVEIAAGLVVAVSPRFGGLLVAAWLGGDHRQPAAGGRIRGRRAARLRPAAGRPDAGSPGERVLGDASSTDGAWSPLLAAPPDNASMETHGLGRTPLRRQARTATRRSRACTTSCSGRRVSSCVAAGGARRGPRRGPRRPGTQSADDALVAVLGKLDDFRGDSRFTHLGVQVRPARGGGEAAPARVAGPRGRARARDAGRRSPDGPRPQQTRRAERAARRAPGRRSRLT